MESMNKYYNNNMASSFITKTYHMVSDPATDHLIAWSRANNSFVVIDPLEFSRLVLPSYFNHNNFSSFVRQLNTYGFKKVDPDRLEFANEWFLRGQRHLLKNMVRKGRHGHTHNYHRQRSSDVRDTTTAGEIERLKREQSVMEEELRKMSNRLEVAERRREQTVAFLCKVVEDPGILARVRVRRDAKRRRIVAAEEEEGGGSSGFRSLSPDVETRAPPPYPFSLFSDGV